MQYLTTNQQMTGNPHYQRQELGSALRCLPRSSVSWTANHVSEKVHYYALLFSLHKGTTQKEKKISQAKPEVPKLPGK